MISAQYGTEFIDSHYDKIKKVYSIWVCMNPPKKWQNSITRYVVTEENLIGTVKQKKADYDLMCSGIQIQMTRQLEREVTEMCNLSKGVEERGREKGRQENMIEVAKRMLADGMLPLEKIAEYSRLSIDEVAALKENKTV